MRYLRGFKRLFKIFHKHSYLITNGFYTLQNLDQVDLIKVCQICGKRETFLLNKETLLEVVSLYPLAFDETLREYLVTWKGD